MREWNYYILTTSGQAYQIEGGIVVARGNYKPLANSPIGWDTISIVWERSATKYGITRTFTLPLGLVIESQTIITYLNWTGNFEQQLNLLINRRVLYIDTDKYYFWYKFFYKAELDLSTYKYDNENARADVSVMEGGLSKQLNANQDTIYTSSLDTDFILVKMDGIILKSVRNFVNPGQTVTSLDSPAFSVPIVNLPGENDGIGVIGQSQTETDSTTGILLWADPIPVHVFGIISVFLNDIVRTLQWVLNKIKVDSSLEFIRQTTVDLGSGADPTFQYDFPIDDVISLLPGEQLLVTMICLGPTLAALPDRTFRFVETKITANLDSRGATSYIKAKKPSLLGAALTGFMTGDAANFKSDKLLANDGIVVTSGDGIRGIEGANIKTSFNQYFNSYNVVLNLGCGIEENKIVIEEKAHFYQTDNPIELGQVKQYKDNWAQDHLFNTLNVGYPDVNIDDVNGKYAFNTSVIWSSPVTRIKKEFTLKSDYKADPFEIELMRIKYLGQSTTDALQDNDIYFLKVDLSAPETLGDGRVVYPLYRRPLTITGIPNGDTVFNIDLSPRRIVNTHANWIGGIFSEFQTGKLHFESTQRNRDLNAGGIDEDADIVISSLGAPLFKPVNFDFISPFIASGDLSMNSIYAYKENNEWIVSGGDPNDTSNPYEGTKAIKITGTVSPTTTLIAPEFIPFSILNQINLYMKLGAAVSTLSTLSIGFYRGTVLGRTIHPFFSHGSTSYQHIIANSASFIVADSTIAEFDRITITLAVIGGGTLYIDNVNLSINPQVDLTGIMDENPNRCFSFTHPNGKTLRGHSMKVGAAPNTEQEQGFLLLATGDTDLKDLII